MAFKTRYPTEPIQVWPKMKELRRAHAKRNAALQDAGNPVVVGVIENFLALLEGLGDFAMFQYEPRYTAVMRDTTEAIKNLEASEAYGFARHLCGSLRLHIGSVMRGRLTYALKGKKPTFVFESGICVFAAKTAQFVSEYVDVPVVILEAPSRNRPGPVDEDYLVGQMQEVIEQMEKLTGRAFDDERLIEGTRNEWETAVLWAEICELNKAVPAPIDFRHMESLRTPAILGRVKPEVTAYYRELLDEVKDRVARGISARGFEDARLLLEGFLPFYNVNVARWPEEYGAIIIGGGFGFTFGAWALDLEGRIKPTQRWLERGKSLRTREDALRALVDLYIGNENERRLGAARPFDGRPGEVLWRAKEWRAQGVIMGQERQCPMECVSEFEQMAQLRKAGIPCVDYAPSTSDPQQFDEKVSYNRISVLLEQLGLHKEAPSLAPAGEIDKD